MNLGGGSALRGTLSRVRRYLATSLWVAPACAVVLAVVGAKVLLRVDAHLADDLRGWYLYGGQAAGARELLSTIASSMLTFTGLVFSITILVLQLASAQFSSRVLRTFLQDRFARIAMGVFVGAFVYAMVLLPEIRTDSDGSSGFVPGLSVYVAFVLVLISVLVFVRYIHHMAHSIRAVQVLRRVGEETQSSIELAYPTQGEDAPPSQLRAPADPPAQRVVRRSSGGVLARVDEASLMKVARRGEAVIRLVPALGDFVPRGGALFEVWAEQRLDEEALLETIDLTVERTPEQDPGFGFRQLVDVAERALSPGINDPTTAVQALDQLHDLLRSLVERPFPSELRVDRDGQLRLVLPRPSWDDYVHLACDELRQYGASSLQVHRRMRALLEDLLTVASTERQAPLRHQLTLLDLAAARSFPTPADQERSRMSSTQGQGRG